jgi:hypothetical protein
MMRTADQRDVAVPVMRRFGASLAPHTPTEHRTA